LVADSAGDLFGTTTAGGAFGAGTVFELQHGSGALTTVATFNNSNGSGPHASLIKDAAGNLFGTTIAGGPFKGGTVFEVKQGTHSILTLASFDGTNGSAPYAPLVEDSTGDLLSTTFFSGAPYDGTVFEIQPGSATITTLSTFHGGDGASSYSDLVGDNSGNFFGTTSKGGLYNDGTVFEVSAPHLNALVGAFYSQTLIAGGGTGALTFSAPASELPPGLHLSSLGVLSGTPARAGIYSILVTATDALGAQGSYSYTLVVAAPMTFTRAVTPVRPARPGVTSAPAFSHFPTSLPATNVRAVAMVQQGDARQQQNAAPLGERAELRPAQREILPLQVFADFLINPFNDPFAT
jgi:uncharacterized repeat protein (TIGR03803 family)